jgi:hypothetical protein
MPFQIVQSEHDPSIRYALWVGDFDETSVAEIGTSGCNGLRLSRPVYTKRVNLDPLATLTRLRGLNLYGIDRIDNLYFLRGMNSLEKFATDSRIPAGSPLSDLIGLRRIFGKWSPTLPKADRWPQIEYLNLSSVRDLQDLADHPVETLTRLQVSFSPSLARLDFGRLRNLEHVEFHYCPNIESFNPMTDLEFAKTISLSRCRTFVGFPRLGSNLNTILVENCGRIERLGSDPDSLLPPRLFLIGCEIGELALSQIKNNLDRFEKLVLPPKYRRVLGV